MEESTTTTLQTQQQTPQVSIRKKKKKKKHKDPTWCNKTIFNDEQLSKQLTFLPSFAWLVDVFQAEGVSTLACGIKAYSLLTQFKGTLVKPILQQLHAPSFIGGKSSYFSADSFYVLPSLGRNSLLLNRTWLLHKAFDSKALANSNTLFLRCYHCCLWALDGGNNHKMCVYNVEVRKEDGGGGEKLKQKKK